MFYQASSLLVFTLISVLVNGSCKEECVSATFKRQLSRLYNPTTSRITSSVAYSPLDCAKLCASKSTCQSANFIASTLQCTLYASTASDPSTKTETATSATTSATYEKQEASPDTIDESDVGLWDFLQTIFNRTFNGVLQMQVSEEDASQQSRNLLESNAQSLYLYNITCLRTNPPASVVHPSPKTADQDVDITTISSETANMIYHSLLANISRHFDKLSKTFSDSHQTSVPPEIFNQSLPLRNCSTSVTYRSFPNVQLLGTIIGVSSNVATEAACAERCFQTVFCQSVNFDSHRRRCELMIDTDQSAMTPVTTPDPLHFPQGSLLKPTSSVAHLTDIECVGNDVENEKSFLGSMLPVLLWILNAGQGVVPVLGANPAKRTTLTPASIPTLATTQSGAINNIGNRSACGQPIVTPRISNFAINYLPTADTTRIIGGTEAKPHSWPWQVSLRYRGFHICGGSLVSTLSVITAAHCVWQDQQNLDRYTVVLGAHSKTRPEPGEIQAKVSKITINPKYNSPMPQSNDIAVLWLDRQIPLSSQIQLVCVADSDDVKPGTQCVVSGWGKTPSGNPDTLQQVVVPIISQSVCNDPRHYNARIDQSMLCAGYELGGRDSCQGDSGGPLVCLHNNQWELEGVVSWGEGCARPYRPGVYTRVSRMATFINQAVVPPVMRVSP